MTEKTLFQKIADREIPSEIVFEDDLCLAFRDINPQAPTHVLIVPKKPIPSVDDVTEDDEPTIGHLFSAARQVAASEGLSSGYRLVVNCGEDGQQTVLHLHVHLLGGRQMQWPPG